MTQADAAYWSMVLGMVCLIVGCGAVITYFAFYPSELLPDPESLNYYEKTRRWTNIAAAVSAVLILLFFLPALKITWEMSPQEFLREYQQYVGRGINP